MNTTITQTKSNEWLKTAVLAILIGIAILLFGMVISRMGLLNGMMSRSAETAVTLPPSTLTYTTKEMRFGQTELTVQAGQEVTLQLENYDLYAHSFDIDALNLHVEMPANGQATATFTAPEPGSYSIYCGVPGHEEAGMIATLVVTP